MGSAGVSGWYDYHPDRVWANELPTSKRDVVRQEHNRKVFLPAHERPDSWRQLWDTWEAMSDRVGLPDCGRSWRWCAWPRTPYENGYAPLRPIRYSDPVREVRRTKEVKAEMEREAARW